VDVDIEFLEDFRPSPEMKGPSLLARLEAGGQVEDSRGMATFRGGRRAQLRIIFPPVARKVRKVTVRLSGDLGEWTLTVPVKPLGGVARLPQSISGGRSSRRGVTLEVTGAIFGADATVVRITASCEAPIRFIRGIGTDGHRRPPGAEFTLADDRGNEYTELADTDVRPDPAGRELSASRRVATALS
jgi:hypothetical protein